MGPSGRRALSVRGRKGVLGRSAFRGGSDSCGPHREIQGQLKTPSSEKCTEAHLTNAPLSFKGCHPPLPRSLPQSPCPEQRPFLCPPDGGSECLSSAEQMDSEDVLSALGWSRPDRPRQDSKAAGGAFPALSPMVVMKNVLVRQVRRDEPPTTASVRGAGQAVGRRVRARPGAGTVAPHTDGSVEGLQEW